MPGRQRRHTADGTQIQLWTCNGTGAQTGPAPARRSGRWASASTSSGGGTANGTKVQLWTCNGTGAQNWVVESNGAVRNPQSGRCLESPGGQTGDGTALRIWDCNGGANQRWIFPRRDSLGRTEARTARSRGVGPSVDGARVASRPFAPNAPTGPPSTRRPLLRGGSRSVPGGPGLHPVNCAGLLTKAAQCLGWSAVPVPVRGEAQSPRPGDCRPRHPLAQISSRLN